MTQAFAAASCKATAQDPSVRWDDGEVLVVFRNGWPRWISLVRERIPCVYILASRRKGTLYVGVTSNLPARIWQHCNDVVEGFTKRYRVHELTWFELHETMESAITREKAIKAWKHAWKNELIEKSDPYWRDLYAEICD